MHNISYQVVGKELVIKVDISAKALAAAVPSSTGKTKLLASSRGAEKVAGEFGGARCEFSINVTLK